MGGVDQNDAQLEHYSPLRKSYKWTTKVFVHYFDEATFNSFIIHKKIGGKVRFLDFKLLIINGLLQPARVNIGETKVHKGAHHPEVIPPNDKKEKPQEMCRLSPEWYQEGNSLSM